MRSGPVSPCRPSWARASGSARSWGSGSPGCWRWCSTSSRPASPPRDRSTPTWPRGLGPAVALVVGVAMVLAYGVLAGFGLTGGVRRLEAAWVANGGDQPGAPVGWVLLTLLVVGCVAAIHRGVHWSTRAVLVAETASVVLLCAILALWLVRHGAPGPEVLSLSGASSERVLAGAALIATLTVAFESCATVGLETDRPLRAVPGSMRTSLLVTGCLFLAANLVGTVQPDREAGYTWRWFAVGQEVSRADAAALVVLAVSMAALAVCAWMALSRLLFSFAREGVLPAGVGRTNGHGVPVVATWCALPRGRGRAAGRLADGERHAVRAGGPAPDNDPPHGRRLRLRRAGPGAVPALARRAPSRDDRAGGGGCGGRRRRHLAVGVRRRPAGAPAPGRRRDGGPGLERRPGRSRAPAAAPGRRARGDARRRRPGVDGSGGPPWRPVTGATGETATSPGNRRPSTARSPCSRPWPSWARG
ncbi:APC family permease [Nocardioides sp. TF02-7]|uniref:APC family permease n=1 Tax=Nocardioides sp. TF02-7 TaxID=2917724 RepID=UPI001F05FEE2|nr:APC family permease [Nocardioides sp. TF02-7]UMG93883.1 APC family permease [Nocardioides sp. TF02-7]